MSIRKKRKKLPNAQRGRPEPVAQRPNLLWSMDFVSDSLSSGQRVRILSILDESTRECLASVADTSIIGQHVTRILDQVIETYGKPNKS